MKRLILSAGLLVFALTSLVGLAVAQGTSTGTVHGKCTDTQGSPITDAQVVWKNQDDGRTYKLKTNKKGEYFSLGVEPGKYTVTLSKEDKVLDEQKNVHVPVDDFPYDINLKQNQEQAIKDTAKKQGVSTEQLQQQVQQNQAQTEKAKQYNANVAAAKEKLTAAAALMKATPPDYAQAITLYKQATDLVPDQPGVWYSLGVAYLNSARTQTDASQRTEQNTQAYNNLQKAVDMSKSAAQTPGAKPPDNHNLAVYYDNLGAAAARVGKLDEAQNDYQQAATVDPANAATYNFNLGVTLYNSALDENGRKKAAEAFDKVIAADPNKADAYYLKGADLFAMVTPTADGKMTAPAGTTEALQKYLELQPNGTHAAEAKGMLDALNTKVETSYGTKSKKK